MLQSLTTQFEAPLSYWTSDAIAEVDFLIQHKDKIIPVEVKSDENVRRKSLAFYGNKYAPTLKIRYSLKNLEYNNGLLNIPLFLADHTKRFVDLI